MWNVENWNVAIKNKYPCTRHSTQFWPVRSQPHTTKIQLLELTSGLLSTITYKMMKKWINQSLCQPRHHMPWAILNFIVSIQLRLNNTRYGPCDIIYAYNEDLRYILIRLHVVSPYYAMLMFSQKPLHIEISAWRINYNYIICNYIYQ